MKTREEVEDLKKQWACDPIWDIENTEGFEEYYAELAAYSRDMEARWAREYDAHMANEAERVGITDNTKLLNYLLRLEERIAQLERNNEARDI